MSKYSFNPLLKYGFDMVGKTVEKNTEKESGGNENGNANNGENSDTKPEYDTDTAAQLYDEYKNGNVLKLDFTTGESLTVQLGQLFTMRCLEVTLNADSYSYGDLMVSVTDTLNNTNDYKTAQETIENNLKNTVYTKFICGDDVTIPENLKIRFVAVLKMTDDTDESSIVEFVYTFTAFNGRYNQGERLYSVKYGELDYQLKKLVKE